MGQFEKSGMGVWGTLTPWGQKITAVLVFGSS